MKQLLSIENVFQESVNNKKIKYFLKVSDKNNLVDS